MPPPGSAVDADEVSDHRAIGQDQMVGEDAATIIAGDRASGNVCYALDRQSPAATFIREIVGYRAVLHGQSTTSINDNGPIVVVILRDVTVADHDRCTGAGRAIAPPALYGASLPLMVELTMVRWLLSPAKNSPAIRIARTIGADIAVGHGKAAAAEEDRPTFALQAVVGACVAAGQRQALQCDVGAVASDSDDARTVIAVDRDPCAAVDRQIPGYA